MLIETERHRALREMDHDEILQGIDCDAFVNPGEVIQRIQEAQRHYGVPAGVLAGMTEEARDQMSEFGYLDTVTVAEWNRWMVPLLDEITLRIRGESTMRPGRIPCYFTARHIGCIYITAGDIIDAANDMGIPAGDRAHINDQVVAASAPGVSGRLDVLKPLLIALAVAPDWTPMLRSENVPFWYPETEEEAAKREAQEARLRGPQRQVFPFAERMHARIEAAEARIQARVDRLKARFGGRNPDNHNGPR